MKRLLVILFAMLAIGCVTTSDKKDSNTVNTRPDKKEGPLPKVKGVSKPPKELKLTSVLYELAIAPDKERFAKENDIFLSKGTVRVFISFDPVSPNSEREKLVKTYNIVVEKKSNNLLRGLVPIDRLIPLSKESSIWSIRLPDRPIK